MVWSRLHVRNSTPHTILYSGEILPTIARKHSFSGELLALFHQFGPSPGRPFRGGAATFISRPWPTYLDIIDVPAPEAVEVIRLIAEFKADNLAERFRRQGFGVLFPIVGATFDPEVSKNSNRRIRFASRW